MVAAVTPRFSAEGRVLSVKWSVPGMISQNGILDTFFSCTSTDTATMQVGVELSRRLIRIFTRDGEGRRAIFGGTDLFQRDRHWRDYLVFSEYFHGDNGAGIGASHQTGWTGLVAKLIQQQGEQPAAGGVAC
jgi:hypothetical protein